MNRSFKHFHKKSKGKSRGNPKSRKVIARIVKQVIQSEVEHKYHDVIFNQVALNISSSVLLNALSLGNTETTRIGISVKIFKIEIKLVFTSTAETALSRVAILADKEAAGGTYAYNQLYNSALTYGAQNWYYLSPYNNAQVPSRFSVIMDRYIEQSTDWKSTIFVVNTIHTNMNVVYFDGANAGTIADISKNALWLDLQSNSNTSSDIFYGWIRVHYTDL